MDTTQAFNILNLPITTTENEIKKTYKKMSLKTHPDKPGGSEEDFKQLGEACEIALEYYNTIKYSYKIRSTDNEKPKKSFQEIIKEMTEEKNKREKEQKEKDVKYEKETKKWEEDLKKIKKML